MPLLSKNLLCFHKIIQNNIVIFYDFMIRDSKRRKNVYRKDKLIHKNAIKVFCMFIE